MTAYVIAGNDVTNVEAMEKYVAEAVKTLEPYGDRLLAPKLSQLIEGGEIDHKEGDWKPSRIVIIKFADMDKARDWYNSPEYQEIMHFRLEESIGSLLFAQGVD